MESQGRNISHTSGTEVPGQAQVIISISYSRANLVPFEYLRISKQKKKKFKRFASIQSFFLWFPFNEYIPSSFSLPWLQMRNDENMRQGSKNTGQDTNFLQQVKIHWKNKPPID